MRTILFCGLLAVAGCDFAPPQEQATAKKKESRKWERDEFKKLVIGKTQEELVSLIGKPKRTSDDSTGLTYVYEGITIDKATGKADYMILIFFNNNGTVRSVDF